LGIITKSPVTLVDRRDISQQIVPKREGKVDLVEKKQEISNLKNRRRFVKLAEWKVGTLGDLRVQR
jgi:hypothetical protein